jgi:hypothetical protein
MMEKFKTDGMIVRNQQGECMGIFSATNLLNIRGERIEELQKNLNEAMELLSEAAPLVAKVYLRQKWFNRLAALKEGK